MRQKDSGQYAFIVMGVATACYTFTFTILFIHHSFFVNHKNLDQSVQVQNKTFDCSLMNLINQIQ